MFTYYKTRGISLLDKLEELYKQYGYYSNYLKSYEFEGSSGFAKMNAIMDSLRDGLKSVGQILVNKVIDYSKGVNGLPKSNVIKLYLEDGTTIVVRPSGTEPKLKIYLSLIGKSIKDSNDKSVVLFNEIEKILQ